MFSDFFFVNLLISLICSIIIVVCSIAILIAIKFQKKQKQKYNRCLKLVQERKGQLINDIGNNQIDINVNIKLMTELYNKYISFIDKLNNYDINFENLLTKNMIEICINKINNYKLSGYQEIIDGIELINYSVIEYSQEILKFRINMQCFNYKKRNDKIVSGSKINKVESVVIVTFENIDNNWLIGDCEKVYQKKLSN